MSPANDFDGDGVSDPLFISIARDNSLNWSVLSGATGQQIASAQSVGKVGDNITPAKWMSSAHASLGYQSLVGTALTWFAQDASGQWQSRVFGKKGDLAISGGDFDGDGVTDAVIVRPSHGRLLWVVRRNFFGVSSAAIKRRVLPSKKELFFGVKGDTPFFVSPDGVTDYIAVLKADGKSIQMHSVYTNTLRTFKTGAKGVGILRPLALRRGALPDFLVLATRGSGSTAFTTVSTKGTVMGKATVPSSGEIVLGDFTTAGIDEVAVQSGAQFTLLNPRTSATHTETWSSAIPVDDININSYNSVISPTPPPVPTSGGGSSGGGGGAVVAGPRQDNPPPTAGESLAQICTAMHPMNTSVLYKNGSGGTADARTGHPTFLWYDGFTDDPNVDKLYLLSSSGAEIGIMGLYSPSIRPLVRFYSGYSPGTGETGQVLKSKAIATSGSASVYIYSRNGNCWGPILDTNGRSGGK